MSDPIERGSDPAGPDRRPGGRVEPRLQGAAAHPPAWQPAPAPPAPSMLRSAWNARWVRRVVIATGVAIALLLLLRKPLAEWFWPDTRAQELLERAGVALSHGRLSAPDGSGARELYQAALAIDPDRNDARVGLARVGQAALARARHAIAAQRYVDAHRDLQLAQALMVPAAQSDVVAQLLREREASHAGIGRLLARAADAREAHRLDGAADAALPLYQQVLALEPDRLEALEGREDALSDLLQVAMQDLQRGALPDAAARIAAARGYDSGNAELPAAQERLGKALEQKRLGADRDQRRGRLASATRAYQQVLQVQPDDAAARRGLERVAAAYARHAENFAKDFRFADARDELARATALAPGTPAVLAASRHLQQARKAITGQPALPTRERQRRVRDLLAAAEAAEARGDLLAPPGDSAFDKLRAARALAPDDPAVRRAGARLLPAARSCFDRELRANSLGRARACLDAWIAVAVGNAEVNGARRRLAERWLAVGDERLGAGDLGGAAAALASARAVDARTPGIHDFSQRLATASAGH